MRGRTNTLDGVSLNASTANKIIKAGNITAGDFVQYYTDHPYIEISGSADVRSSFIGNIGQYTICEWYNGISLFKNGELLDSYTNYQIRRACINEDFIIFVSGTSAIIGVLGIENDHLVLIDSIAFTNSDSVNIKIAASDEKIVIGDSGNSKLSACDISDLGALSNLHTQNQSGVRLVLYNSDDFYIMDGWSTSSCNIKKLSFGLDNEISIASTISVSGNNPYDKVLYIDSDMFVIEGTSSTSQRTIRAIYFDTGNVVSFNVQDYAITQIEDGVFLCGSYGYLYLYSFNKTAMTVELLMSLENVGFTVCQYGYVPSGLNNGLVYIQGTGQAYKDKFYLYEILGGLVLQALTDKNYVIPFAQYGYPIGVAKEGGTINDTIAVYIPTVSL